MSKVIILDLKSIARLYNNKGEIIAESEGVWVNSEPEADLILVQYKKNEKLTDK